MPMAFFFHNFFNDGKENVMYFLHLHWASNLFECKCVSKLVSWAWGFLDIFHKHCRFPQTLKARSRYYLDLISFCLVLSLAFLTISQHPQGCSAVVIP